MVPKNPEFNVHFFGAEKVRYSAHLFFGKTSFVFLTNDIMGFYAPPQKVAGYYVIPSDILSVCPSICPSVSGSSFVSAP